MNLPGHQIAVVAATAKSARRLAGALTLLLLCQGLSAPAQPAAPPTLWYIPPSNLKAPKGYIRDADFPQLFAEPVTWPDALRRVGVFGMPSSYITKAADEDLRRAFAFLNAHHIALAVEWPVVDGTVNGRGEGVEGVIHHPHFSQKIAQRLKLLNAHLDYLETDEPLCFGHYFKQGRSVVPGGPERIGCQYAIDDVAVQAAGAIREVRAVYPGLKVVETEPVCGVGSPAEFSQWLAALKKNLGDIPLAGVDLDVQWERAWQAPSVALVDAIRQSGLSYGLIVDGGPHDATDRSWVEHAQHNLDEWNRLIPVPPGRLRFQSWHERPSHVLPETSPETMLSLINAWAAAHPEPAPPASVSNHLGEKLPSPP